MTITEIAPAEAARYLENGSAILVDVRTPVEFAGLHATPALNIPLDRLAEDAAPSVGAFQPAGSVSR